MSMCVPCLHHLYATNATKVLGDAVILTEGRDPHEESRNGAIIIGSSLPIREKYN